MQDRNGNRPTRYHFGPVAETVRDRNGLYSTQHVDMMNELYESIYFTLAR